MLENLLTDKEKTRSNRNVVLQKGAENAMDRICKKSKFFKENGNRNQNQKETPEIFRTHL